MSKPNDLGPMLQLLKIKVPSSTVFKDWHVFTISPRDKGRAAGEWCNKNVLGEWTFMPEFSAVTFYIKEDSDAMLFKLTWNS